MRITKRQFLKTLALSAASAAVARDGVAAMQADAPKRYAMGVIPPKYWIWIPPDEKKSVDDWKRDLAQMRAAGIKAIVPEIYDGRHAWFPSQRLPVKTDLLGRLLPLAKAEGLEVHAWMWTMPCMVESVMKQHPDWYNVNAKGESAVDKPAYVDYYKFLDPARPEVREFVQGTVRELAAIGELTGVHLDYVRHPDAILPKSLWPKYNIDQSVVHPQFDYGYTPYAREAFKKAHGIDPMTIKDPTSHRAWMQYRFDAVTGLVNDFLVPAAHAKQKQITAAVFPGPSLARDMVRQDWGRWKLDAFLPMLYHTFYEADPSWVTRYTKEAVSTVRVPVYSGIFAHALNASELSATIAAAKAGGAYGVSLFSAGGMDDAKWQAFRAATQGGSKWAGSS